MSRDSKQDLETLRKIFGPKLSEALDFIQDDEGWQVEIPDAESVDMTLQKLAGLVAKSSNAYGRLTRLYGIASAEYKLAKGAYDYAYKTARGEGSNADERKANALEQVEAEHQRMVAAESIMHMIGRMEDGARVASESARKILDKMVDMGKADLRENAVGYKNDNLGDPPFDVLSSPPNKQDFESNTKDTTKDARWG